MHSVPRRIRASTDSSCNPFEIRLGSTPSTGGRPRGEEPRPWLSNRYICRVVGAAVAMTPARTPVVFDAASAARLDRDYSTPAIREQRVRFRKVIAARPGEVGL